MPTKIIWVGKLSLYFNKKIRTCLKKGQNRCWWLLFLLLRAHESCKYCFNLVGLVLSCTYIPCCHCVFQVIKNGLTAVMDCFSPVRWRWLFFILINRFCAICSWTNTRLRTVLSNVPVLNECIPMHLWNVLCNKNLSKKLFRTSFYLYLCLWQW